MIKAIVTDVDGVIVGKKHGVNFPLPNEKVITRLNQLQKRGIPVVLCTAKFNHAIKEIIVKADLRNPHITDGGALIIDPLDKKVIRKHIFDKALARDLVEKFTTHGIYLEVYGAEEYYLQKDHVGELTEKRLRILQKRHIPVDSLLDKVDELEIIKISPFAHNEEEKDRIAQILEPFKEKTHYIWTHHPFILPTIHAVVTVKGVSKKDAALEVLRYLRISPDETLGVGDLISDWNFMSVCRSVGVVGDASDELKSLAQTKGEGNYFFGSSVDEDGFLQIIDYFI